MIPADIEYSIHRKWLMARARAYSGRGRLSRAARRGRKYRKGYAPRRRSSRTITRTGGFRNLQGGELKVKDTAIDLDFANANGSAALLNGLYQGSTFYNRVGRRVVIKKIGLHLQITPNSDAAAVIPAQTCRILLVQDRQWNSAAGPLLAPTVLADQIDETTISTSSLSFNNLQWRDRFRVLMDKFYQFPPYNVSVQPSSGQNGWLLKRNIRLNLPVTYTGVDGFAANIATNALWLLVLGETTVASGEFYTLSGSARIRFVDP